MANSFKLSVVAPDRTVFEDEVTSIVAPGVEGYLGVMAGHEPIIAALRSGVVELMDKANVRLHLAVTGGFLEVSDNQAIILADDARLASEVNVAEEQHALEEARKALRGEASEFTSEQAQHEIERAVARLKAAKVM